MDDHRAVGMAHQRDPDRPEQQAADLAAAPRAHHHESGVPGQLEQLLAWVLKTEHLVDHELGCLPRDLRAGPL